MPIEDLTLQLQRLTLDEYRLTKKLREKQEEIERVRARINRHPDNEHLQIGDRVHIHNPTTFSPLVQGWNEKESQAVITGITYNKTDPNSVGTYKLTTDNGTKTWRKPKNIARIF